MLQKSDSDLTASKGRKKYLDFIDTLLEAKVLVYMCVCVCVCVCVLLLTVVKHNILTAI